MSTVVTNNYTLQIGHWNAPQIISFDSLFETYSVKNVFENEENKKITSVINEWKGRAIEHLDFLKSSEKVWFQPTFNAYVKGDQKYAITHSRRTAHVVHRDTPNIIYKTYTTAPGRGHPMANTLRPPMASIIAQTISNENLTDVDVPKKALFPIVSKDEIGKLDERKINEAFVTCSEKIHVFGQSETVEKVREMSEQSQERLAEQCCQIPLKTGLGDFRWHNLQMHRENDKLYILDTEPLYGELFIDKFGEGFEFCAKGISGCHLSARAKFGLSEFSSSSREMGLEIFQNTAQSFLEKLD
jgi:hypothetical protein